MKRILILTLIIGGALAGTACSAHAEGTNEAALIEVLQSKTSSPKQKTQACAQLKREGTKASAKALGALLPDPALSHSARYVLETLPGPEADAALLDALPKTHGLMQAGIIDSLAMRTNAAVVPKLGKLLSSTENGVAVASAKALGKIGGSKALGYLEADIKQSTNGLHRIEVDSVLTIANQLLATGKQKEALKLFESIYTNEKTDFVRQGAFRGIILSSGKQSLARMTDAIVKGDGPTQSAALGLATQMEGANVTKTLAALLTTNAPVPVQLALIQCLAQRDDPAAMPEVVKAVESPDVDVRTAALAALGKLGDASVVALLADKATSGVGKERAAARESLLELHRGLVTQALVSLATSTNGFIADWALGDRRDVSAMPALLEFAKKDSGGDRIPALQALGKLADGAQIPAMVQLVQSATTDEVRAAAADALNAVFQRLQTAGTKFDLSAFISAIQSGSVETRLALLPICSDVVQEANRAALRAAITDANAQIRDAAIHALCDTKDADLLPDLVNLACDANQPAPRLLAIRGCVRLTTQEDTVKIPDATKLEAFAKILATPLDTQAKRVMLSGLSNIDDAKSLALAVQLLDDTAVRPEAEQAVVRIATDISEKNPNKARNALKKIIADSANPDIKKSAEAALKKIK